MPPIDSRPLDTECPDKEFPTDTFEDTAADTCKDVECPFEPMDPLMDTVTGPCDGGMPIHDNPQALEASELTTAIKNSDAGPKDDCEGHHSIQSNQG